MPDEPIQPEPRAPENTPVPDPEQPLRRRALAAEARAAELQAQLQTITDSLGEARDALTSSERRRIIERQLNAQGAIDLETATLLAEAATTGTSDTDIAAAITDLKRRKPFLFRPAARASAMSGEVAQTPILDDAAHEARRSGDRRALLRYLRLRRGE